MADHQDPVLIHLEYLREGVDGITRRLDEQNGRLRNAEGDIKVLNDRTSEARKTSGQWGGVAGGFAGGFVAALISYFGHGK